MRLIERLARFVVVHGVVAAGLTVLVAWTVTPVGPSYPTGYKITRVIECADARSGEAWSYGFPASTRWRMTPGVCEVEPIPVGWGMSPDELRRFLRDNHSDPSLPHLPGWAAFPSEVGIPPRGPSVWSVASGWPMLAVVGYPTENSPTPNRTHIGGYLPRPQGAGPWAIPFRGYLLPVKPIWPGFLVDTLAFMPVAWALLTAPRLVSRRVRVRRGRCARCAYDLRAIPGIGCPECGWRHAGTSRPRGTLS